ncbi:MAG: hypothetical protein ACR5LA_04105 [Wolbachia sp.]
MLKNGYSNKVSSEDEIVIKKTFINLRNQIMRKEGDKSEKKLLNECRGEADKAKAEVDQLKLQVQEERGNVEAEFKNKIEEAENEAKAAKDELIKCKKDAEKMKENGGQVINQEKYDDTKAKSEQAKEEALKCKIEQEKEEVMRSKIEEVKEELLKCKIDMAKAETEWYKKAAEECKNEKRSGKDKPSIRGGDENDTGKHVTNEGDRTDKDKPSIRGEDKNKPDIVEEDKDEVKETAFIRSQEITQDHANSKCGIMGVYYNTYSHVGRQGFSTSDLLEAFYPEMYSNPKIVEHLEMGANSFYGAVNYKFIFSEHFDYSWGNASNMWCKKCADNPQETACQNDEATSFCYPAGSYANQGYSKSFFAEKSCPNLIKVSGGASIVKAKQVAPLILVNNSGQMIDKEGNNTQVHYNSLKPYLKLNGKIKDCGNDQKCKDYTAIMEKVAWDSDKEVLLKTVFDNVQRTTPYSYDNEVSSSPIDNQLI